MQAVRHLLAQRHLAVLICAAALMMKLLIPAGYMIGSDGSRLSIIPCSGIAAPAGVPMAGAMPEMHGDMAGHGQSEDHGRAGDHGRAEMPCAFSGLSTASLGAVDAVQLAALIAFVMTIGLAGVLLPLRSAPAHLRPPLRGPPPHL